MSTVDGSAFLLGTDFTVHYLPKHLCYEPQKAETIRQNSVSPRTRPNSAYSSLCSFFFFCVCVCVCVCLSMHRQKWPFEDRQNVADKVSAKNFDFAFLRGNEENVRWWPMSTAVSLWSSSAVIRLHSEVKKKLNLSKACLVKGNEQRAKSQPCLKGGYLAFLVALFANFTGCSRQNFAWVFELFTKSCLLA